MVGVYYRKMRRWRRSNRTSIQNVRTGLRDFRIFRIVVTKNPIYLLILKILCGQWAFRLRNNQNPNELRTDAINRVSTQQIPNDQKHQNRIMGFQDFQDCCNNKSCPSFNLENPVRTKGVSATLNDKNPNELRRDAINRVSTQQNVSTIFFVQTLHCNVSTITFSTTIAETLQCNVCTAKKSTFVERSRNEQGSRNDPSATYAQGTLKLQRQGIALSCAATYLRQPSFFIVYRTSFSAPQALRAK